MNTLALQAMQYGRRSDLLLSQTTDPMNENNIACFREIRQALARHGALHRFGMFLIRNQFDASPEEDFLECTDHEARTLTTAPVDKRGAANDRMATNWVFTESSEVASVCCTCARGSNGHLGRHTER